MIKVKKIHADAVLPTKAHEDDAGYDITCISVEKIKDGLFKCYTGISATCDNGSYIRIAPRSGLSVKHGYNVLAGICDKGFTGEYVVIVYSPYGWIPEPNIKIAQIIETKIGNGLVEVDSLEDTERGSKGWGSSGYLSTDCTKNGTSELTVTNNDMIKVYHNNKELIGIFNF